MPALRTLIYNARRPGHTEADFWLIIEPPYISDCGFGLIPEGNFDICIDARSMLLLPGAIDCHVHFREPGMTQKASIASESRAAVAGGVTSFIEMPNTAPPTTSMELLEAKRNIAARSSLANYGFFLGASLDNFATLLSADYSIAAGVKVFMGSSTGPLLVDQDSLLRCIFKQVPALIAVHAEDNLRIAARLEKYKALHGDNVPVHIHSLIRDAYACFLATERAVNLAGEYDTRLHICHITTAEELRLLQGAEIPVSEKRITSEVSPHHLIFTSADYDRCGSRIKMNPAVKGMRDRICLRRALSSGVIDMAATDHAPHLLAEKQGDALTALSGAPAIQFALPALLSLYDEATVERVYCQNPAEVYCIDRRGKIAPGYYADLTLVAETTPYTVSDKMVISPCRWTPMQGLPLRHRIRATYVNGSPAYTAQTSDTPPAFATALSSMPLHFTRG